MNFNTPPVVKNLLIINLIIFLAQTISPIGDDMITWLGLCSWHGSNFMPHQFITNIFLHGSISHLFSNMFALWMFGRILEYDLGSRRFLMYYLITGIGAGLFNMLVGEIQYDSLYNAVEAYIANPSPIAFSNLITSESAIGLTVNQQGMDAWMMMPNNQMYIQQTVDVAREMLAALANRPTIGASGAVFGVLLAFGMLHPNDRIMLLIPPIPMKAKYFVMIYGVIELYLGMSGRETGIAHFAHLGGMLWGFGLLWYWRKTRKIYF